MLEDNFGRRFHYLRLSITDVCNFKCTYCLPDGYQSEEPRKFLSKEEIARVVRGFAELGTSKVRITGGEPSLRKDLPEIIRTTKQTPGIEKVALTTNGYKLSSQIDEWIDNGLDALNVSIDSLDPRMFKAITGHDKLGEIMRGIERAFDRGMKHVKVNTVLMRQFNKNELANFQSWIKDVPVTLRFIELMQTGDNAQFFKDNHVSGDSIKQQLLEQGWTRIIREKHAGPAQEFEHENFAGRVGLIMPYSKDFCSTCNRLRVSARGKLHLCLFSENGLDMRPYLQHDDVQSLTDYIRRMMGDKKVSHFLQDGFTGGTTHLAMLGG